MVFFLSVAHQFRRRLLSIMRSRIADFCSIDGTDHMRSETIVVAQRAWAGWGSSGWNSCA